MILNKSDSRQGFLGPNLDTTLAQTTLGFIGLCGGGGHIVQQIAHIGFGKFVIADFDHVEDTNLTRMIGSQPNDAKRRRQKTAVIKRMIRRIDPAACIDILDAEWQTNTLPFRECSVIFGCVDSIRARAELEAFCRRFRIAYIDIGMDVHVLGANEYAISGQVAVSLPQLPCLRCMGLVTDAALAREAARYGAAGGRPQVVWPNGVLASTAVAQAMAWLLPWTKATVPALLLEYDGNRMTLRESSKLSVIEKQPCPHFEHSSVGDPLFSVATD